MAVNIFVPACQDGTFSFKGPINTAPAHWHCVLAPTLTVSPNDLTQSNSSCSGEGNSWTCTETVGESAASQGDLTWSASSRLPGVSFHPRKVNLSPVGPLDVTISSL